MQYLTKWRGVDQGRKRAADEGFEESSRKRTRDDSGRRESTRAGRATDEEEYKIRGSSTIKQDTSHSFLSSPNRSTSSPLPTEALPSPPSIHPDRRANISNVAPSPAPAPLHSKRDDPSSPRSPSPKRVSKADPEEQECKPLRSPFHTIPTLSTIDPKSPDSASLMPSYLNETSRGSQSHDPRRSSMDSYTHHSNTPSRRQSDVMQPPRTALKSSRAETFTPRATSPPTSSKLENRQVPTTRPIIPVLDSLNGFAQSIMSTVSLTVKRDLIKQQAVGQQKERERQSKFKSTFLTLIEDAESRAEGLERVSVGLDRQIDLSSQTQSKIAITLAAQLQKAAVPDTPSSAWGQARLKDEVADMKASLEAPNKDIDNARNRCRSKDDLADLKADLKTAEKKISHLNREAVMYDEWHKKLRGLATIDELRGLVSKDELRHVTTDEVRKHVTEALVPTEKKIASLTLEDATLNRKIVGVEAIIHKHFLTAQERDNQQSSEFDRLNTSLNNSLNNVKMESSRLERIIQEQKEDYAAVKVDLGAQDKVLTDLDTYVKRQLVDSASELDELVARNSNSIQLLQEDCKKLDESVRQVHDLQAASKTELSSQDFNASAEAGTKIEEEVKLIRHDLDALNADREKVLLIRTDLDSLINEEKLKDVGVVEEFEAIEERLNKHQQVLARLHNETRLVIQAQAPQPIPNHPPTPPFASASTSPLISDQQKLQDVEMEIRKLTQTTQALELFVNCQQQKFDGLTSDRIVQSMVHQMQQMYPQHPGNLVALVNQTVARQARVDGYLGGNLKDHLASIESQIAAQRGADSKIDKLTQFTSESRLILVATVNSLKQDVKGLKDAALNNRPQDPSIYGNRINELADRVTTVEAKYIKAIGDFQTNLTDLVRNVTHLQHQNGNGSSKNTPEESTVMSRSSKSVEPSRTNVSFEDTDASDNSDAPLSQRSGRRPSDPGLKRKIVNSDDAKENEGEEARPTKATKIPKRRNVSGMSSFS